MNRHKSLKSLVLSVSMALVLLVGMGLPAAAEEADTGTGTGADTSVTAAATATVVSDADIVRDLGILQGEGGGLTPEYMGKSSTRIQAAILFLRLNGLENAALTYKGTDSFSDAGSIWSGGQAILAYLKANPQLGWAGIGDNKFDPLGVITSEQFYKVVLEALGYKQDTDFQYADVLKTAETAGLSKVAGAKPFKNVDIATAIVEALDAKVKGSEKTLASLLVDSKLVKADSLSALTYSRVEYATNDALGRYLVDGEVKTLYYFSKDASNLDACQAKCLQAWPIYYAEKLKVPAELDKNDFGVLVRADGSKQTTYKGWPLYYYAGDTKAGDTAGDNLGKVWFVVEAPAFTAIAQKEGIGNYLTDSNGKTLYYFDKDTNGVSNCFGTCEANWPVYYKENLQAPTGTTQADFGVYVRPDGTKQSTYKGYPLYYYVKDAKMGDTTGQGVGNVWYVVDPAAFTSTKAQDYDVKTVKTASEGTVLVDAKGMALYTFANDKADVESCQGKCLAAWPIFHGENLKLSADLNADDFGMIMRKDGTMQSTYKGWPLYYYVKDVYPGQITGQRVGNVWFLAGPDATSPRQPAATDEEQTPQGNAYTIEIKDFAFNSEELTVEAGSTITFTNLDDGVKHNAVAVDGSFATPLLAKGESATITLDKPGVYEYYCEPHKDFMEGKIIVK